MPQLTARRSPCSQASCSSWVATSSYASGCVTIWKYRYAPYTVNITNAAGGGAGGAGGAGRGGERPPRGCDHVGLLHVQCGGGIASLKGGEGVGDAP